MSGGPKASVTSRASISTAAVERTSSACRRAAARPSSLPGSRSVAITRAPSAMNPSLMARPMPCPAAVTTATLSFSRSLIIPSPEERAHRVLMVIAGHAEFLCDTLELDCTLEHHAVGELIDHGALDLLPWRLAGRELEAAGLLERGAAPGEFGVRRQHVGGPIVE